MVMGLVHDSERECLDARTDAWSASSSATISASAASDTAPGESAGRASASVGSIGGVEPAVEPADPGDGVDVSLRSAAKQGREVDASGAADFDYMPTATDDVDVRWGAVPAYPWDGRLV